VGSSEKDVTASYRDGILEIRSALASPPAAKPVAHLAIKH
jgi:HSP20 family molecular chaperone IbpA